MLKMFCNYPKPSKTVTRQKNKLFFEIFLFFSKKIENIQNAKKLKK